MKPIEGNKKNYQTVFKYKAPRLILKIRTANKKDSFSDKYKLSREICIISSINVSDQQTNNVKDLNNETRKVMLMNMN